MKHIFNRKTLYHLISSLMLLLAGSWTGAADTAKNIILLISDGCGYYHVDAVTLYQYGATGRQVYEYFPHRYAVSTGSLFLNGKGTTTETEYEPDQAWRFFDYVKKHYTDSAASATAMSSGVKTVNGAIGVDAKRQPVRHITEGAKELGKSVGVVTSVQWSHATPAGFVAHNPSRKNYTEIAREMLLDSRCDVIMGCGHPLFNNDGQPTEHADYKHVGGPSIWTGLLSGETECDTDDDGICDKTLQDIDTDSVPDPWTLIQTLSDFQWLQAGPTPKRVLGIPQVRSTLQYDRTGIVHEPQWDKPEVPYSTPLLTTVPNLKEMALAALNVLDNDPDGFFLMVEGGAVDWASHGHNAARMIEEQIDFNQSVETVVQWVEDNSNWDETLVIVTGDHETGYLTGPGSGYRATDPHDEPVPIWNPLTNNGVGQVPGLEWHSETHTNSVLPLYAKGAGSGYFQEYIQGTDPVRGPYVDNTAVARVMWRSIGHRVGE